MHMPISEILQCADKNQLKKLCKSATITMDDFANFILVCKAGFTHLNHTMHFTDFVPPELEEKPDDWKILKSGSAAHASKEGQKALCRLFKSHGKRQVRIGHMFFSKEMADRKS